MDDNRGPEKTKAWQERDSIDIGSKDCLNYDMSKNVSKKKFTYECKKELLEDDLPEESSVSWCFSPKSKTSWDCFILITLNKQLKLSFHIWMSWTSKS